MLEIEGLSASYGSILALKELTLYVSPGEIVAIVGANGAGKTTALSVISGLIRPRRGDVRWNGKTITGLAVETVVALGIAHCPEGRRVFPGLTVMENLMTGAAVRPRADKLGPDLDLIFSLFPRLAERRTQRGWSLSGGEQQMLAIGRALMSRPKLLMLDEPSLGLAPIVVEQVFDRIRDLNREAGLAILLVEQNAAMALEISARAYVLETGSVILSGEADVLADNPRVKNAYLGG